MTTGTKIWLGLGVAVTGLITVVVAGVSRSAKLPPGTPSRTPLPAGFTLYTVQAGEYLSSIAAKAYAQLDRAYELWPILYDANRDTIGPNPDVIAKGDVLRIPNPETLSGAQINDARARFKAALT